MDNSEDLYSVLASYTLSKKDPEFIHQLVVDTNAAQNASPNDKPIKLTFALIGLYLFFEKGYTGKEVQRMHKLIANKRKDWPRFLVPVNFWRLTIKDVVKMPEGEKRDEAIKRWGLSVWQEYKKGNFEEIENLVKSLLG